MPYNPQYLTTCLTLSNLRRCSLCLLLLAVLLPFALAQNVITLTPEQAAAMGILPTTHATLPASAALVNETTGTVAPGLEAVTMLPMAAPGTVQGNIVLQSAPGMVAPSGFAANTVIVDGAFTETFVDVSTGMPLVSGLDTVAFGAVGEIVTPVTPPSMVAIRTTEDMQQLRQDNQPTMLSLPTLSAEDLSMALHSAQIAYSQPLIIGGHVPHAFLTAEVLVFSSPLHADMFIAGEFVGTTPLVLEVPINTDIAYELLARDSRPFRGLINVSQNDQLFVQLLRAPSP